MRRKQRLFFFFFFVLLVGFLLLPPQQQPATVLFLRCTFLIPLEASVCISVLDSDGISSSLNFRITCLWKLQVCCMMFPRSIGLGCFLFLAVFIFQTSAFTRLGQRFVNKNVLGSTIDQSIMDAESQLAKAVDKEGTYIMRHPGTCTGMYWRASPSKGKQTFRGPPDWPRNGAILKGYVRKLSEQPEKSLYWLQVKEYQQADGSGFEKTPEDCWMQFNQEGILLHPH